MLTSSSLTPGSELHPFSCVSEGYRNQKLLDCLLWESQLFASQNKGIHAPTSGLAQLATNPVLRQPHTFLPQPTSSLPFTFFDGLPRRLLEFYIPLLTESASKQVQELQLQFRAWDACIDWLEGTK
ncbi:hypothetical protein BC826DRAFT_150102 [Russula brevipes]|nr:hypothetical protein BC826DRAFT_150102 [Russula brevipes]